MSLPYNAVKRFYSTDLGAPTLSGQAGSLIGLLDAILVNGYGTVSIAGITRSGSTVTVETSTAHGHDAGTVIKIAGADQTDYNGEWIVASMIDSTHLTFDCGTATPVSPATGSMTLRRAAMNLTKAFTGTNTAAYQLPAGTSQALLRIDDTPTTYANVTGYESMTDVDTGVNSLASGTSVIGKSSTADATARPWVAFCDDRWIWLMVKWHATAGQYQLYGWGDPVVFNPLDVYCNSLISDTASGGGSPGNNGAAMYLSIYGMDIYRTFSGQRIARGYNQIGTSVAAGKYSLASCIYQYSPGTTYIGQAPSNGLMPYPAPHDNGLYVCPIYLLQGGVFRGLLPGIQAPMHNLNAFASQEIITDIASLPGRGVQMMLCNYSASSSSNAGFDITGPWR